VLGDYAVNQAERQDYRPRRGGLADEFEKAAKKRLAGTSARANLPASKNTDFNAIN
jgi:hypothetical protein